MIGKHDDDPNTPHKELAPEGYHVSTYFEWYFLKEYYGGDPFASYYLRSELGWFADINGNNESGLNLLPGFGVNTTTNPNNNGFYGIEIDWILQSSLYATSTPTGPYNLRGVRVGQSSVDLTSYDFVAYSGAMSGYFVRLVKN